MEIFHKVLHCSAFAAILLTILSSCVSSEGDHPPWHKTILQTIEKRAPLLGMDDKDRLLNDFFVIINKREVREKSRDECIEKLAEYIKSRITKNTDYYDVKRVYAFGDLVVLRIKLPERLVSILQEHTSVKVVEANTRIAIQGVNITHGNEICTTQDTGTELWGLSRISNTGTINTKSQYSYVKSPGQYRDISVYVVDTGVYDKHSEFYPGQVVHGYTSENVAKEGNDDLFGHGTHVAGTIAGKTYGVAKGAPIISVKTLGKDGEGTAADIMDGIQWIYDDFTARKKTLGNRAKGIINMSLGAGVVHQVMEASMLETFQDLGVTFVVAAGNSGADACSFSPARQSWLITVGATDQDDVMGHYSNYGPCVDILAPGSGIRSATIGSPTASAVSDGTSMAAPHVTGVLTRYLDTQCEAPSPEVLKGWLQHYATESAVTLMDIGITPNKLLYMPCFWDDSQLTRGTFFVSENTGSDELTRIGMYIGFGVVSFLLIIVIIIGISVCVSVRSEPRHRRLNRV